MHDISSLLTINGTANITNSFCLGFDNTEHCMKGGIDERLWNDNADNGNGACTATLTPVFSANAQIIQNYQTFYNLTVNGNHSQCWFDDNEYRCGKGTVYDDSYGYIRADTRGSVSVIKGSYQCVFTKWYDSEDSTSVCGGID